jgi:hypothetical protein
VDLTRVLLRAGATRPHVLAVTMPGATAVRLAAEDYLRRRCWPEAMTPADADILLICGDPVAPMATAVAETWRATPAPRAQAMAACPAEVAGALDEARARLADRDSQRALAPVGARSALLRHSRAGQQPGISGHHTETGHGDHDAMGGHDGEMRHADHGEMGYSDPGEMQADHGDMAGMDMGGMDMHMATGPVRGLPMAHEGDDRDGLRLDRLHVPLGPVLPDWPAGLVVRLTLQGDARGAAVLDRDLGAFHGRGRYSRAAAQPCMPRWSLRLPRRSPSGTAVWCDSTFGEPHASTMMKTS